MVASDDVVKVSVGFIGEGGRERRIVGRGGKKNKNDNFGKSLDPGVISTQNMQSA